jgi:hypothetical protein
MMSWTKRQFCETALEEIGITADVLESDPGLLESARKRLDAMMAEWNGRGIRVGYPLAGSPGDGDLDAVTAVPDMANEAIYTALAVRIAPTYGKTPMPETKATAARGYQVLCSRAAFPRQRQMPADMPLGAGNKPILDRYVRPPIDPLVTVDGGADITFD